MARAAGSPGGKASTRVMSVPSVAMLSVSTMAASTVELTARRLRRAGGAGFGRVTVRTYGPWL